MKAGFLFSLTLVQQPQVCHYLLNISEGGADTRTVWSLPMLDLEKGECFARDIRDGRTGEDLRGF